MTSKLFISAILFATICLISCNKKGDKQSEEQIVISSSAQESSSNDSLLNSVSGNVTMKQIATFPSK